MRIALISSSKTTKLYPIALLKIGAYLKDQGHECEIFDQRLPEEGKFDEAWINTLFTFEIPDVRGYIAEAKKRGMKVKLGGVSSSLMPGSFPGEDIHIGLHKEAETFLPDYSLLKKSYDYSIAWTSRGCIRKCSFCVVPKIEGKMSTVHNWEDTLNPDPEAKRILFFDNNWTAKPMQEKVRDKEVLVDLVKSGRIKKIDFNQGIDARLVNKKIADLIGDMPFEVIRFAFDDISSQAEVEKAITLCAERGHRVYRLYMLYNFEDRPVEFYRRLVAIQNLQDKIKKEVGVKTQLELFPMRYAPIMTEGRGRKFIGKNWTTQQRRGVSQMLSRISVTGMISNTSMDELKHDWGNTEDTFVKLLSYPKLDEYMDKKRAEKRLIRAGMLDGV